MIDLIIFVVSLGVAYGVGTWVEKSHYREIIEREKALISLPAVSSKDIEYIDNIEEAQLVYASVVISLDYFKRFLAGLRNIVGGRISSYESLLDRGRREAILRMKQRALEQNFQLVINMRFETASIGTVSKKGNLGCFEVMAYGTAVRLKND